MKASSTFWNSASGQRRLVIVDEELFTLVNVRLAQLCQIGVIPGVRSNDETSEASVKPPRCTERSKGCCHPPSV